MLSNFLFVLFLTNQLSGVLSPTPEPPCNWRYQWSDTLDANIKMPPNDTECHLYFSDTLSLVNDDNIPHMLYRVDTQAKFNVCDSTDPIHSVSVGAESTYSVTMNLGSFLFVVLESVYLISEKYDESCLKLAFFLSGDTSRNCSIDKMGGVCYMPLPETTTTTTTPPVVPPNPTLAYSGVSSGLNGVEIFLLVACCLLFLTDIAAVSILIYLYFFLFSHASCRITLQGRGGQGTEMKAPVSGSWKPKRIS